MRGQLLGDLKGSTKKRSWHISCIDQDLNRATNRSVSHKFYVLNQVAWCNIEYGFPTWLGIKVEVDAHVRIDNLNETFSQVSWLI
jgi:hypothetical protein